MLNVKTFSVRVVDLKRDPVSKASVSLHSQSKRSKPIQLDWNDKTNLYTAMVSTQETFTLTVSATGFESQERKISLPKSATVEEFVLGKKGMPYYYRGKVKTPFEPKTELVGLTIAPGIKDGRKKIAKLAKGLKLSEVKTGEQIRNNNVVILQHNDNASDEEKEKILDSLLRNDAVHLAGPVVELFDERAVYLTSQLVVKFTSNVTQKLAEDYGRRHKLRMVRAIRYIGNAYLFEAQTKADYSLLQTAIALTELDDVEYAEPNSVTTSMLFAINPADFLVSQQWHIPLINLPDAWQALQDENATGVTQGQPGDLTFGDENLVIAVADTGIQSSTTAGVTTPLHPDFAGTVTGGAPKVAALYDFINMVPNNDTLGLGSDHGMGCAGVVAAQAENAASVASEVEGVAGAAGNCQVIGMVVPFGETNQRWADALVWMAGFNPGWTADGINYPLGTVFPAPPNPGASIHTNSTRIPDVGLLDDTLDYLATYGREGRGIISFLAAGNTAANISHPANNTIADHDKVITVAASINTDVRSGYSCFDPTIDICAPSNGDAAQTAAGAPGKVTTDTIGGGNLAGQTGGALNYRNNFGGTSSATPLAAGVGALMLSINPQLNWVQVRELLRNTATKIDAANTDAIGQWTTDGSGNPVFSQWYGFGRVNAAAAVEGARDFGSGSDVVIRDNLSDTGIVPSGGWHANSPDIWVRKTDDPIPTLAYSAAPPHQNPVRGQDNYVYLRAKNTGTATTNEVYLRALICHYPGFEFRYPEEWQPSSPPSSAPPSPLVPGSYLIGEVLVDNLAPSADTIVKMQWDQNLIPPETVMVGGMSVNWHPCLLAEVSPHDGPEPAGATFDVKRYNDLAHKNIAIDDAATTSGFSTFGVVAGTAAKMGVRSLVLDRSRLRADTRVFVYSEDANTMKTWINLIRKGKVSGAETLPWRPHQPDRNDDENCEYTPKEPDSCSVTLLSPAKLSVDCCDGRSLIIDAPRKTRIWTGHASVVAKKPKVSVGRANGKDVVFFDGDWSDSLELPMPLSGGQFTSLAIGVERSTEGAYGALLANQRRADGELSAGYEIRG